MASSGSDLARLLQQLLVAAQRAAVAVRDEARLTPNEYAAVQHLAHHPGGLTPSQLATRLGITSGSTTKLVDRLEARNLATRRRDRTDRRSMTLRPTKTAIRLADKEGQLLEALLAPLDATLDRHEQATIASYLGAAITQASNHAPS